MKLNAKFSKIMLAGAMTLAMGASPLLASANQAALQAQQVKETNIVKNEEVKFLLDFQVANTDKISSLVITDDLEDVLLLKGARVLDKDQKDITNQGKLVLDNKTETVTWTANEPAKFFGQKIYLEITAALKPNVDLDQYFNKETGKIEIPNVGKIIINETEIPTDKVVVVPPPSIKPAISKKIEKSDGKTVEFSSINFEEDIVYTNTAQVPTNRKLTKVELFDQLESVLIYKSAKVLDANKKDITDTGKLTHDPKTNIVSWIANKPEEQDGKVLKLQITAQVQNIPELAAYLQDGKVVIPNKAVLKINDDNTESNKVTVTPPTIKNKAEKFVSKTTTEKAPDKETEGSETEESATTDEKESSSKEKEETSTEESTKDSSEKTTSAKEATPKKVKNTDKK